MTRVNLRELASYDGRVEAINRLYDEALAGSRVGLMPGDLARANQDRRAEITHEGAELRFDGEPFTYDHDMAAVARGRVEYVNRFSNVDLTILREIGKSSVQGS